MAGVSHPGPIESRQQGLPTRRFVGRVFQPDQRPGRFGQGGRKQIEHGFLVRLRVEQQISASAPLVRKQRADLDQAFDARRNQHDASQELVTLGDDERAKRPAGGELFQPLRDQFCAGRRNGHGAARPKSVPRICLRAPSGEGIDSHNSQPAHVSLLGSRGSDVVPNVVASKSSSHLSVCCL